jgi:hypothetical protein
VRGGSLVTVSALGLDVFGSLADARCSFDGVLVPARLNRS